MDRTLQQILQLVLDQVREIEGLQSVIKQQQEKLKLLESQAEKV